MNWAPPPGSDSASNLASVSVDDPLRHCEAEPGPRVLRREERLEELRARVRREPRACVADRHARATGRGVHAHLDAPRDPGRLRRVLHEVQHHLPELLRVALNLPLAGDRHVEVLDQPSLAEPGDRLLAQRPEINRLWLDAQRPRQVEQPVDDELRAERLVLNHLQVLRDGAVGPSPEQPRVPEDHRERVVNLVGDPCGEAADARELLALHELLLMVLQGGRHRVELAGERAELVGRVHVEARVEVAARETGGARLEPGDGTRHGAEHVGADHDGEQPGRTGRRRSSTGRRTSGERRRRAGSRRWTPRSDRRAGRRDPGSG